MKKVVIIHGNGGCTAQSHWTPWLKTELEKKNIYVIAPTMPDNIKAKASIWLPYMLDTLKCDENTLIVGHSSGAIAALKFAETHKILGSMLIGVYHTDLGMESEKKAGYFDTPWNWKKIKAHQKSIAVVASRDDPYIPIEEALFIQKNTNAQYLEFTDQGHFMDTTLPESVLQKIIEQIK